jgi:DNA-binding response OmpR family regulator
MERLARLLVVEDESLLRGLVAQFLQNEGFQVIEAADGLEGVETHAEAGPIDLVLMDLNLPRLSGVEACRRIRAAVPNQPILVCSASILDGNEQELRSLGIEHYLPKPFHPRALLHAIRAILEPLDLRRVVA